MARIDQMWQMRQSGATLEWIDQAFGISRERVRRLLREHRGSTAMVGLLTRPQLAELAGCSLSYITKLRRRGIIQPVTIPSRKGGLWRVDSLGKVISYERPPRLRSERQSLHHDFGICYRLYEKQDDRWKWVAYLNLLRLRDRHPHLVDIKGASEVFVSMMPK